MSQHIYSSCAQSALFCLLDVKEISKLTYAHKRRKKMKKKKPCSDGSFAWFFKRKMVWPHELSEYAVMTAHITSAIRRIIYFSTLRSLFQRNTHATTSRILKRLLSTHLLKISRFLTGRHSEGGKQFICRKAVLLWDQIHIRAARSGQQNKSEENHIPRFESPKKWLRPEFTSHCRLQWYARD